MIISNPGRNHSYLLCVGRQEEFRWKDFLAFPFVWSFSIVLLSPSPSLSPSLSLSLSLSWEVNWSRSLIFFLSRFDLSNFYKDDQNGLEFKGPPWDPLRVLVNLAAWNMFVLVPIFYCAIFSFRKAKDLVPGKYDSEHFYLIKGATLQLHWISSFLFHNEPRHQWVWTTETEGQQQFRSKDQFCCLVAWGDFELIQV